MTRQSGAGSSSSLPPPEIAAKIRGTPSYAAAHVPAEELPESFFEARRPFRLKPGVCRRRQERLLGCVRTGRRASVGVQILTGTVIEGPSRTTTNPTTLGSCRGCAVVVVALDDGVHLRRLRSGGGHTVTVDVANVRPEVTPLPRPQSFPISLRSTPTPCPLTPTRATSP